MKKNADYEVGIRFRDDKGEDWIAYPNDSVYAKVKALVDANKPLIIPQSEMLAGWGMPTDKEDVPAEKWNHLSAIRRIKDKIENDKFPLAKKPLSTDGVEFPEDITKLNSRELGVLLSKFEAWRAYVHTKLVFIDVERKIMIDAYEIGLGKCLFNMEKSSEKKRLKESLIGFIVATVPALRRAKERIIEVDAEYAAFSRLQEMYTGSIFAISREISRRQGEMIGVSREVGLK